MNAHASAKKSEAAEAAVSIDATVDLADFRAAISVAADLVEDRNTYPALGCILIEAGDGVVVSYRGLDSSLRRPVKGSGFGSVLLPKRVLTAFLRAASGDVVTIKKGAGDSDVTLADSAGLTMAAVPMGMGAPIADYVTKLLMTAREFALAEGVLAHLFAMTMPFISNEETRYYLNGVCLQFEDEGDTIRATATDGHRMGSRTAGLPARFKLAKDEAIPTFIIPADAVKFLSKHIAALEVRVRITDALASFVAGGMVFTTKLIEGPFPDWRRVVPDFSHAGAVVIDQKDARRFLSAAKAMRPGSPRFGSRALRIFAESGRVKFEVKDHDTGTMTATIAGTAPNTIGGPLSVKTGSVAPAEVPTDFGLNAAYLHGVLKVVGGKTARLLVRSPGDPVRVTADEELPGQHMGDLVMLMPMRV